MRKLDSLLVFGLSAVVFASFFREHFPSMAALYAAMTGISVLFGPVRPGLSAGANGDPPLAAAEGAGGGPAGVVPADRRTVSGKRRPVPPGLAADRICLL